MTNQNNPDRRQSIMDKISILNEKETELIHEAQKLLHGPRTSDKMICLNTLYDDYRRLLTQKEFCEYCLMFDYIEPEL